MKRPRSLASFPPEYRRFLEQAVTQDRAFIPCVAKNPRITLRSQFYQLFRAMREEAKVWETQKGLKGPNPWYVQMADWTEKVTIKMTEDGLMFLPKSATPLAEILRAATFGEVEEIPQMAGKKVKVEDEELKAQLSEMFGEGEWVEVVPGG